MGNSPTISLCMIARDEAPVIGRALASVRSIVGEIILVDTGSKDETIQIANEFGATVITYEWKDDFSEPRNISLQNATCDWILVLDADEAIAPEQLSIIQSLILNPNNCYELTQRHYSNDHRLSLFENVKGEYPELEKGYGGFFESSLVRLFPNHRGIHYIGRVHELVEHSIRKIAGLTIVRSPIKIHHYGQTEEVRARKNKDSLYTSLGQTKIVENPDNWQAYFELGVEHNVNGRREESVPAFVASIEMNPHYVPTWLNLGYVLCELGRYQEAVQALATAVQLQPGCSEAYCNLGVVYLRIQQYPIAEKHFRKAIQLNPGYVNAFCNLGKALGNQARLAEAANMFERAIELLPQCVTAIEDLKALYEFSEKQASRNPKRGTGVLASHPVHSSE